MSSNASDAISGDASKGHVKPTLVVDAGPGGGALQILNQAAGDKAAEAAGASAGKAANTSSAGAASAGANANAAAANGAQSRQTQAFAAEDATVATQGFANAEIDRPAAGSAAQSAAATSNSSGAANTQGGSSAGATNTNGLPNFGFIVANASASSGATQAPGSAATPAVPISGLAVAIAARAQEGSNQFDIRLDPPELGRIDVRLDVDSSGQVTSHVTVERADTLELLQNQQPQLERALEQAGLKTADNGLSFSLRDQSFAGQNNNGGTLAGHSGSAQLVIPDADLPPVAASQIYSRIGLGGGVDIRV